MTALALAACSSQKQPAQAAYAQVEASVAPVREDLEQYAPEEYEQLNTLIDQMKARLNSSDYEGALTVQPQVMAQLGTASAAAAKKKNQWVASLNVDWRVLAVTVPRMINQLNLRVSDLKGMAKLPSNVVRDAVQRAQTALPELTTDWKTALDASRRNDLVTAVNKAQGIKKRCTELAGLLGTKLAD